MKDLRVAIITEFINSTGGSDRVIESLLDLFPSSEIFTATFTPKNYPNLKTKVHTPKFFGWVLQKGIGRRITVFMPFLFEQFDLKGFDIVVSVSAGASKGVITYPGQPHISIICTPPRHQWDGDINVRGSALRFIYHLGSKIISSYIRVWDITAVARIDHLISISKFIQKKVFKRYRRNSEVIYPGIKEFWFEKPAKQQVKEVTQKYNLSEEYYIVVSRLFDYKRVDWAIKACGIGGKHLVIVGEGPDRGYLEKIAKRFAPGLVHFLGRRENEEILALYQHAKALLFCGIEDFGLVPVEAMATGTPVLALKAGGLLETVEEGKSGLFFETIEELSEIIKDDRVRKINPKWCIMRARNFTQQKFKKQIYSYITKVYEEEKRY